MVASLRIAGECSLFCLSDGTNNYEIFALLYDLNKSEYLYLRYEIYHSFCFDFRFFKNGIFRLKKILRIPDNISCANFVKIDDIEEAFCMFPKQFAYPC